MGVGVGFHSTNINTKSDIAREAGFSSTAEIESGSVGKIGGWIALIVCIFSSFRSKHLLWTFCWICCLVYFSFY